MTAAPAAILIAGPTASGKSRLARELAARHDGAIIINADAMQVYAELRILTARPSTDETRTVPHRLYGHVPASIPYSVGRWLEDVAAALAEARAGSRLPIVVGGTGLYFRALTRGLAAVPAVSAEIRDRLRRETADMPAAALHDRLARRHAGEAARVRPADRSRILRALEVLEATGRPLSEWQAAPAVPILDPTSARRLVLDPPRDELRRRIDARFDAMLAEGAIEEALAIGGLGLDPALPAMKAIGLRPLLGHLAGGLSLDEAAANARADTRRYAKRQFTWFRNQMPDWERVPA